jgi:hypothetical protein
MSAWPVGRSARPVLGMLTPALRRDACDTAAARASSVHRCCGKVPNPKLDTLHEGVQHSTPACECATYQQRGPHLLVVAELLVDGVEHARVRLQPGAGVEDERRKALQRQAGQPRVGVRLAGKVLSHSRDVHSSGWQDPVGRLTQKQRPASTVDIVVCMLVQGSQRHRTS